MPSNADDNTDSKGISSQKTLTAKKTSHAKDHEEREKQGFL